MEPARLLRNVILICRIKRNKEIVERLRQFDDHSWNWTSLTRHFSDNELLTTAKGSKSSSKLSLAASEAQTDEVLNPKRLGLDS